jgi:predicted secreted protein
MKKTIPLVLALALGLATEIANADFTFGEPTNLGPVVNSPYDDGSPDISADGLTLYFDSLRPDGAGSWDIWLTRRETVDAEWGPSEPLGPSINSGYGESGPCISADGLTLYFASNRPGGKDDYDIWVTKRQSVQEPWGEPVNLGPTVNSWAYDNHPSVSADGLCLYFDSRRPNTSGSLGNNDLYVTKRASLADDWGVPTNLGPAINTDQIQYSPNILPDGLTLFFDSRITDRDLWMTTRKSTDDDWTPAVSLGPPMNTQYIDTDPSMWVDGCILYFVSTRPGGTGRFDIWQASVEPVVDLNGDGIVDAADMCIMVDHWGTDEPLCDIGPMPWGDGIVDVQDLIVLAEHLFEHFPPVESEEVNVDEQDNGSQIDLKQGQILVITLQSNPTTGYRWEQVENQDSTLEQMGEAEFKPSETGGPPPVGDGGWEIFHYKAVSAGQKTLTLVYHRPWEEGVEPLRTFSLQIVVR